MFDHRIFQLNGCWNQKKWKSLNIWYRNRHLDFREKALVLLWTHLAFVESRVHHYFATQLFWFAFHSISNFSGRVGGYIPPKSICHQATALRCTPLKSQIPRHWRCHQKGVSTIMETRGSWLLQKTRKDGENLCCYVTVQKGYLVLKVDFVRFHPLDYCECGIESEWHHQKNHVLPLQIQGKMGGGYSFSRITYNHESGNWLYLKGNC